MNNTVIGGLAVVGVVGVLSAGYLSQLKDHIKGLLGGGSTSTGADNTLSLGGNPTDLGTAGAPQLPASSSGPFLSSTAAGSPTTGAPGLSTSGQPTAFAPGTLTLDLRSKGIGIVQIPDNTSTDTIRVGGQYIKNWRSFLISPLIPGNLTTRVS